MLLYGQTANDAIVEGELLLDGKRIGSTRRVVNGTFQYWLNFEEPLSRAGTHRVGVRIIEQKYQTVETGEIHIGVSWDVPSDRDLHLVDPRGEYVYFAERTTVAGDDWTSIPTLPAGSTGSAMRTSRGHETEVHTTIRPEQIGVAITIETRE